MADRVICPTAANLGLRTLTETSKKNEIQLAVIDNLLTYSSEILDTITLQIEL